MSIHALEAKGLLQRVGDELIEPDEQSVCDVFGTETFVEWRDNELPLIEGDGASDLTPDEEVDDFLRRLQLQKPITDVARLQPTAQGIWEARLQQVRLFGWFPKTHYMILVRGAYIKDVKPPNGAGYRPFYEAVRDARKQFRLDYVAGDIRAVLPKPVCSEE